jgi:hypothetical protein
MVRGKKKGTRHTEKAITTAVYDAASQSINTIVSLQMKGRYARGHGAEGAVYKLQRWQQMTHGYEKTMLVG